MESVFIGFYSPIVLHFAFQDQVEDKSRENGFAQVEEENYNLEGPVGPSIPDHTHSFPIQMYQNMFPPISRWEMIGLAGGRWQTRWGSGELEDQEPDL